jgi:hypothetical protein
MQSAAEDEMSFEQGAAVAKNLQDFVFGHGDRVSTDRLRIVQAKVDGGARPTAIKLSGVFNTPLFYGCVGSGKISKRSV